MSSAGFTSGRELLSVRNHDQSLPVIGEKQEEAGQSWLEEMMLDKRLQEHHILLKEPKTSRKDQMSTGEWLPQSHMVKLINLTGKFWHHMGAETDIGKCLYPEEALYLIETGELEVMHGGIPLSMQQAQILLLQDSHHMDQYLVYSHLSRLGCKVVHHQTHLLFTKYEKEIRIDQHQADRKGTKLKLSTSKDLSPENLDKGDSKQQAKAFEEFYASLGKAAENPLKSGKVEASSAVTPGIFTSQITEEKVGNKNLHLHQEEENLHEIKRKEIIEMFPDMLGKEVMFVEVEPVELLPKNSIPSRKTYRISLQALEYYSKYETRPLYHLEYLSYETWNKQHPWTQAKTERWNPNAKDSNWQSWGEPQPAWGHRGTGSRTRQSQPHRESHHRWREDRNGRWSSADEYDWQTCDNREPGLSFGDTHDRDQHCLNHGEFIDFSLWPEWKRKRRMKHRQQGTNSYPSALVKVRSIVNSWKQYKHVVAEMSARKQLIHGSARTLWEGRTTPLVTPSHYTAITTAASSLSSTAFSSMLLSCSLGTAVTNFATFRDILPKEDQLEVLYDVYLPNVIYKKSKPSTPSKRVAVMRGEGMPSPGQIFELTTRFMDSVVVACAVVTCGEVRLYTFSPVALPPPPSAQGTPSLQL